MSQNGDVLIQFQTSGINPIVNSLDYIEERVSEFFIQTKDSVDIQNVFFYGAGCLNETINSNIKKAFAKTSPRVSVEVYSDMMGAARALLGNSKGIACILGTGSNSCLFDGDKIISQTPSLGFIAGDEGSGSVLGKKLTADYFKNQMPEELRKSFEDDFKLSLGEYIENVYRKSNPNVYLASFVVFLKNHSSHQYVKDLVINEFCRFIRRNLCNYYDYSNIPVGFIGSIANGFQEQLREAGKKEGIMVDKIMKSPINSLKEYHNSLYTI